MSAYSIALFLHLVGVLALFAGIGIEQVALRQLRNARSVAQVREWMTLMRSRRRIDGPAALVLLLSGGYLIGHGAGYHAWVGAGLAGMVLMAVLGAGVGRPRFVAIGRALAQAGDPLPSSLRARLEDPVLRYSAAARAALGLGVVFDMVVKPGAAGAIIVLAAALAIGVAGALGRSAGARGALAGSE
jgi:hypothetical protein